MLSLYLWAISPAILIVVFFFFRDKFREPPKIVFYTFVLGFLFILPLSFLNIIFDDFAYGLKASYFAKDVFKHLFRAAFHEELYKYLILIFFCSRHTKFNEPMDAVVYGIAVSLGFSAHENINYILNFQDYNSTWQEMAAIRFVPTVMHGTNGVVMGMFLSQALFFKLPAQRRLLLALLVPVFFHGIYNLLVVNSFGLGLIFLLIVLIYVFSLYRKLRALQSFKIIEDEIKYSAEVGLVMKSILMTLGIVVLTTFLVINIF